MTPSDYAFLNFIGTSCRERMSREEQRLFDFYKGWRANRDPNSAIEQQIQQYADSKRKRK